MSVYFILTAEFDLDAGPIINFQYPPQHDSLQSSNHTLMAELMLPDGSHTRTEDWTVFFLYRQGNDLVYNIADEEERSKAEMFYVLNLVNTKFDKELRRGSSVKSMCLISKTPFFQVYMPLLILALDDYFKNPQIEVLKKLYDAINSIDITDIPKLSPIEKQLLASSTSTQMFLEKFIEPPTPTSPRSSYGNIYAGSNARASMGSTIGSNAGSYSGSNTRASVGSTLGGAVTNSSSTMGISKGRGSVASFTSIPSSPKSNTSSVVLSPTSQGGQYYLDLKSQGQRVIQQGTLIKDTHFWESKVDYNGLKIPIKIPTDFHSESVSEFSLIRLISTLTKCDNIPFTNLHPEITIYGAKTPPLIAFINALLTQKRILFIGLNTQARYVSEHVLAACSLASGGILRGFTRHAFPYTDLSKVDDLLNTEGYIAGVKNPTFGHHSSWWDVIVDIEAGTMKISESIATVASPVSTHNSKRNSSGASSDMSASLSSGAQPEFNAFGGEISAEDSAFVAELKRMLANHYGESSVRARCRQYIKRFIRIATNYEMNRYQYSRLWPISDPLDKERYHAVGGYGFAWRDEKQKYQDIECYSAVIEGWRQSRSYRSYCSEMRSPNGWPRSPKYLVDYDYQIDRLRTQRLSYEDASSIHKLLTEYAVDYNDLNRLLCATSSSLIYVAYGLFHPDESTRHCTIELLRRIEQHPAGKILFSGLNRFQLQAFRRQQEELLNDSRDVQTVTTVETEATLL